MENRKCFAVQDPKTNLSEIVIFSIETYNMNFLIQEIDEGWQFIQM